MVETRVGVLFKLEVLHRFYANAACPDFRVLPSAQTTAVIAGQQIVVKQYRHLLYAGVSFDKDGKPFPLPPPAMQLCFFLQLKNPLFFHYTNLPSSLPASGIYYFTNRNNNAVNGKQFLSAATQPFEGTKTYQVGDLALHASGTVYQAIRLKEAANPVAFPDPGYWAAVDNNRYASEADALQWLPSVSTYRFASPQSSANIQVEGYNAASGNYSAVVLAKTISFSQALSSFQLDLSVLPVGKYLLTVNGEKKWIYLNDELSRTKAFAVVEIFNEAGLSASNRLLDASGQLLSPLFSLLFLNRSTVWKYVLRSGRSGTITDTAGAFQFSGPDSTILSLAPIPLQDSAKNFTLHIGPEAFTRIACASPEKMSVIERDGNQYPCSEIFLNN